MPNYRVVEAVVDTRTLRITVLPRGARSNRGLRGWPYWSGSKVAITVDIDELKREGQANELLYELASDIEHRTMPLLVNGKVKEFPLHLESPWEYISAPDEYRYELWLGGQSWTVADFSAHSKDRVVLTVGVTILGVMLASLVSFILFLLR